MIANSVPKMCFKAEQPTETKKVENKGREKGINIFYK